MSGAWDSEMSPHLYPHLTREGIQMADKHLKGCSRSFVIGELQIKATMSYHYTPIRKARIQNTDNTKCWWGCKQQELLQVQILLKTVWQFLIKLHTLIIHPAIMLLVVYLNELKTYVHTRTCTQIFITAELIIAKTWKHQRCPLVHRSPTFLALGTGAYMRI